MSIYKMQLDTAVTEEGSSHSLQLPPLLPPDTLEQHETPDKLQWLSHHMAKERKKNAPSNHKKLVFDYPLVSSRPFPRVWAHFVAVQSRGCEANESVSGDGALRNGPLFGNSLSLQRWKCETLIDHFNWKPFVLRGREAAGKRSDKRSL